MVEALKSERLEEPKPRLASTELQRSKVQVPPQSFKTFTCCRARHQLSHVDGLSLQISRKTLLWYSSCMPLQEALHRKVYELVKYCKKEISSAVWAASSLITRGETRRLVTTMVNLEIKIKQFPTFLDKSYSDLLVFFFKQRSVISYHKRLLSSQPIRIKGQVVSWLKFLSYVNCCEIIMTVAYAWKYKSKSVSTTNIHIIGTFILQRFISIGM